MVEKTAFAFTLILAAALLTGLFIIFLYGMPTLLDKIGLPPPDSHSDFSYWAAYTIPYILVAALLGIYFHVVASGLKDEE